MGTYAVIITCRNSESNIESAISSLWKQTIRPNYVIVIDDGSSDSTPKILQNLQAVNTNIYILTNADMGYDIRRVVKNWNKALKLISDLNLERADYHMISADDVEYENSYAEEIMKHMDLDLSIAVASGNYDNYEYLVPRGAGRFVRNSFFNNAYGYYPEKMGYEAEILYSARRLGLKCVVIKSARFKHTRELGSGHHFYQFGASMRTLGYHPLFVLGRVIKYLSTGKPIGRLGAIYMFYYYLSYRPQDEGFDSMHDAETRREIRASQMLRIKRFFGVKRL